jgi:indolepyruvate ferredoxin oxidoreductase beta subunit
VVDAIALAAKQQIIFDMDALAIRHGSVMSSAMFGALAGSGQLPFPREAFHDVIKADGRGVAASLRTFGAAFERAAKPNAAASEAAQADVAAQSTDRGEADEVHPRLQPLLAQITANIPAEAQAMARAGLSLIHISEPTRRS